MIELFEQQLKQNDRSSSKGNQLKWQDGETWYKADYTGYEGLAEYVVSQLLRYSSLRAEEFVIYTPIDIQYKSRVFRGVSSSDFLTKDWQIITLERLYRNQTNESLYKTLWSIPDVTKRFIFLCNTVETMTGLKDFGVYIAKLLTLDVFFKNEDRHLHNIAVLMNESAEFRLCPIFDNGAALLSDTTMDYPLNGEIYALLDTAKSKTISTSFDEQLDAAEAVYPRTLQFLFGKKEIDAVLENAGSYSSEEVERVRTVLYAQMRKYEYLFKNRR